MLTTLIIIATLSFHPILAAAVFLPPLWGSMLWVSPGAHIPPWNTAQGQGEKDVYSSFDYAATDRFLRGGMQPGDFFRFREGIFVVAWNRNGAALAVGDAVKLIAPVTGTLTSATAAILTDSGASFTVPVAPDGDPGLVGEFVFITSGTGAGQVRRILDNTATTLTVAKADPSLQLAATATPQAFGTTPDNTSHYSITSFDQVIGTASANDLVFGVCKGTPANNDIGIIQVAGPTLATCVGSTDALTAMGSVVASGTAKVLKGPTTAGETAADARTSCGYSFDAYASTAALRWIYLTAKNVIGACARQIPR